MVQLTFNVMQNNERLVIIWSILKIQHSIFIVISWIRKILKESTNNYIILYHLYRNNTRIIYFI